MESPSTSSDSEINNLPEIITTSEPSTSTSTKKSSRLRQARPTKCLICGKPAQGYHYEVESCNGCKTFFRRFIMSDRSAKCKMVGDCFDLTKRETPIKCRTCRYEKCIAVGMNPLSMHVDEEEAQRGKFKEITKRKAETPKILENKLETLRNLTTQCDKVERVIDSLNYLEWKVEQFRSCAYNPDWREMSDLSEIINSANRINLANKYGPMKWSELVENEVKGPMKYNPTKRQWFLFDLLTMVEYSKTFEFLNKLDFEDKRRLLKHTTLACMNLHISFYSVARKSDKLVFPDQRDPTKLRGSVYNQSVMSIQPLIRYNVSKTEYILLKAILLCNPAVSDLSQNAQNIVSIQRKEYATALFDYCFSKKDLGPTHFAFLIGIIDTLEHQQMIQKDLHLLHVLPFVKLKKKSERMLLIDDIMEN